VDLKFHLPGRLPDLQPTHAHHRQNESGECQVPLVDNELRRLAASRLARELPGPTLRATALVHEA
jgi:hypothetical protein